ncbi:MAG: response regulator transcription factor [Bdellovibrionales bacterium]|nr:response regulator transcription factor [Bdellovibrionales bacterium]
MNKPEYPSTSTMTTSNRKILIVEDDDSVFEMMEMVLSERHAIVRAKDGEEALSAVLSQKPDLVLLDIGIPKIDGLKVTETLRGDAATSHIPILIITGNDDSEKRISAFNLGADDFLGKPFKAKELAARVSSKIRRIEEAQSEPEVLVCGNLKAKPQNMEVRIADHLVSLSVLEFNLLKHFLTNPNRIISREELLKVVWNGAMVGERTIDTHMVSLRKHLKGFDHQIATVYSAGYILKPNDSG